MSHLLLPRDPFLLNEDFDSSEILHLNSKVVLPVIGQALVELSIFLVGDVIRVPGPDGLGLVQLLLVNILLLDFFLLLLVFILGRVLFIIRAYILNFGLVLSFLLLLFLFLLFFFVFSLVVTDLLVTLLLYLHRHLCKAIISHQFLLPE